MNYGRKSLRGLPSLPDRITIWNWQRQQRAPPRQLETLAIFSDDIHILESSIRDDTKTMEVFLDFCKALTRREMMLTDSAEIDQVRAELVKYRRMASDVEDRIKESHRRLRRLKAEYGSV